MKKQQKPRGNPWPPGTSGNPSGRPRGAKNKLTLAVLEGFRPLQLDRSLPFMVWGDRFLQQGRDFAKDTLEEINPGGPTPLRPEKLDVGELRQKVMWKGKIYLIQGGWLFDPATWKPVKL